MSQDLSFVRQNMEPALPAPQNERGILFWLRKNLFSSWLNSILTFIAICLVYSIVQPIIEFGIIDAIWSSEFNDRRACTTEAQGGSLPDGWFGACWPFIGAFFKLYIYGKYPIDELWRVNIVYFMLFAGIVALAVPRIPFKRATMFFMLVIFPVTAFILLTGGEIKLDGFLPIGIKLDDFLPTGMMLSFFQFWIDYGIITVLLCGISALISKGTDSAIYPGIRNVLATMVGLGIIIGLLATPFGLEEVETEDWGGLLVTLVISVTGIVVSLPLGILLALGRRSHMPAVRLICIVFIEFWRGVPLITVLFMAKVMLPLFMPTGVDIDQLLRALVGVSLFASAYMAEVIRGGIQALPKGQYEGAQALGLNYWQMMRMIILPQALKLVIPGIVNTFIGLFKDTTLVLIVGLFDLLGQIQNTYSNQDWLMPVQASTGYMFAAVVFFSFCYGMSRYSIYMEDKLNTGHR